MLRLVVFRDFKLKIITQHNRLRHTEAIVPIVSCFISILYYSEPKQRIYDVFFYRNTLFKAVKVL